MTAPALGAIDRVLLVPACPSWSLTILAVGMFALFGPFTCGSRANLETV